MSVTKTAVKGGAWLAFFTGVSQLFSWGVTFVVARLLAPGDYGLMDMATIITGYFQVFYQLGIGAAIIQREKVTADELSSLFWVLVGWGSFLAVCCLLLAYPTVAIFDEPRVFRITQAVAVLFVIGSIFIVPRNLLHRELRFKAYGAIMSASIIVSCSAMLLMAYLGAGVWTLIGGHIIREFVQILLVFFVSSWKPRFHFSREEVMPYLKFGLPVVGGTSLQYIYTRADVFFGGRVFGNEVFGHYALAQRLAEIPTVKVISIINNVSYPVFSRYQDDHAEFKNFYLKLVNMIAFIVLPLYGGGIFLAGELIPTVLGEKWISSIGPFRLLCFCHLMIALTTPNHMANTAQGRPHWTFYFNLVCVPLMICGFYFSAATEELNYLALPWAVLFPLMQLIYARATLRRTGIPVGEVLKMLLHPFLATGSMLLMLFMMRSVMFSGGFPDYRSQAFWVAAAVLAGAIWYTTYMLLIQRERVQSVVKLLRS